MTSEENAQMDDWLSQLGQGQVDEAATRRMAQAIARRGGFDRMSNAFDDLRTNAERPSVYPRVNLQRLFAPRLEWPTKLLADALTQARQWMTDSTGDLYVLFKSVLEAEPTRPALSMREESQTARGNRLIAVRIQDDAAQRQIDIEANALNEATCTVEIGVFPSDEDAELLGTEVVLRMGDDEQRTQTNDYGIAVFADVPRASLSQLVVRIASPA